METVDNVAEQSPKQAGMSPPWRLTQSLPLRAEANVNTNWLRLILKVNKQADGLRHRQAGNYDDFIARCFTG